jgi:hypothetical protein
MWNGEKNHDYDSITMNFISQSFQFERVAVGRKQNHLKIDAVSKWSLTIFPTSFHFLSTKTSKICHERITNTYNQLVIYHSIAIIPYISIKKF